MTGHDPGDIIEIGGPVRDRGPRRPWWKWLPLLVVAGVGLAVYARTDGRPEPPPASDAPSATSRGAPVPTTPVVTDLGRPLFGIEAGWQLYGRGPGVVVRLDLARGRITTTAVPALLSSGPVSFLAGPDRVVVRPLDAVPGYVVPDGGPAVKATNDFDRGGPMLPGPDPASVWVSDEEGRAVFLIRFDGRRTGVALAVPPGVRGFAEPDGAGYPLVAATGGVYSLRPGGVRRITTGELVAVGPAHWLVRECDARLRCGTVLIEQRTGARRAVRPGLDETAVGDGLISPDGTMAAVRVTAPGDVPRVRLLDLRSGRAVALDLPADPAPLTQRLVWSPDGRWLFVAAEGHLHAVEAETARIRGLGVALPETDQLALRPA